MTPRSPPSAAVERFTADLRALLPGDGRMGLAVSGGPDSLALLLLGATAFPGRVAAATVDHGLRPEAVDEAQFVATVCATLNVPHRILRVTVPPGASVQAQARAARYAALAGWAAEESLNALLTAHHADDQAETLLMRLTRGSGLGGLAGIRATSEIGGLVVARPLLGWRRDALRALVEEAGLRPVADPSNEDEAHDRVRMRRHLAEAAWLDPVALARSASALAEAEQALDWVVERLAAERVSGEGDALRLDPSDLPPELLRRLVLLCLRRIQPDAVPRGEQVTVLIATLLEGGTATLGTVLCRGGPHFRFALAPRRRHG
ncbi:MAG TPA: tRNA lysidine(34) synthetase TilS [Allosphingosinicella sp.]|jgi:tRNA(Ile)-lysidine synthase|nr:tRNA lysidine(34) synthetase TilS [Allosphingosinicella sp.]